MIAALIRDYYGEWFEIQEKQVLLEENSAPPRIADGGR
jgi:hypothetical protein